MSTELPFFKAYRGESLPEILVVPWLVEASLQSLPPSALRHLLSVCFYPCFSFFSF